MFKSYNETQSIEGTDYIELQLCYLSNNTPIKDIMSNITHKDSNSLFVYFDSQTYTNSYNEFYYIYKDILGNGVVPNLSTTTLDPHSLNYYSIDSTKEIIKNIEINKPLFFEIFLTFLYKALENNGFYIKGF